MFDKSKWNLLTQDDIAVNNLIEKLNISPVCAKLLYNRGIIGEKEAKHFLNKTNLDFYNPFLLTDMYKGVERLDRAIIENETITVYGDYDTDGITATSLIFNYLKDKVDNLYYHVPTRSGEGYGLKNEAFDRIKENGTTLVITVDTGSTGIDETEYAKSLGIDVIITDHHRCKDVLPDSFALINPCRDDSYPFKELAGVGVAFKFITAYEFYKRKDEDKNLITKELCEKYIDLVTLGTIADVVPLKSENRLFAYLGIKMLMQSKNIGIQELFKAAKIDKIGNTTISFQLSPRINACGRMENPDVAVNLFTTDNIDEAKEYAEKLCEYNTLRQDCEAKVRKEAFDIIEKEMLYNDPIIVLDSDEWNVGVLGLVASKVTDKYNKPSIVISFKDDLVNGKGSCRSIKGIDIFKVLEQCSDCLVKSGGHSGAAGLTVEKEKLQDFKTKIKSIVKVISETIVEDPYQFEADMELKAEDITINNYNIIKNMEPFGKDNSVPLFMCSGAKITKLYTISEGRHTKLGLRINNYDFEAVMFSYNLIELGFNVGDEIDIIYNLDLNEYRGYRSISLIINDLDFSGIINDNLLDYQNKLDLILNDKYYIDNNYYPTREDCTYVYRKLQDVISDKEKLISIKMLVDILNEENYIRTGIALIAFSQLGIISMEIKMKGKYLIKLNKVGKVDLYSAPILKNR